MKVLDMKVGQAASEEQKGWRFGPRPFIRQPFCSYDAVWPAAFIQPLHFVVSDSPAPAASTSLVNRPSLLQDKIQRINWCLSDFISSADR
eukprot:g27070.t1